MRLFIVLLFLVLVPLSAQDGMIGWRGDNSGVFPADCRPPTEFDAITGKNLVWKMPLPNFSNSSPIVVGKKVFVVCAAGWPEGQDCAQLLCFDADTGKELWRKDMDEFATMPEAQAKEAREIRKEYHQRIRRLNNLMYEYQSADEAKKSVILKDAAVLGGDVKKCFDMYYWPCSSAEQHIYNDKVFGDKLKKICAYSPITWSPTCLDMNMPTPVSDGKRIFVYSGRRNVYSFDLDGKLLWQVWQSDAPYNAQWPEDLANAPLIADDLLLMYVFDHLWAYELKTGRLVWKVQSGVIRHGMGTPVLLRLPVPGKPDQFEKMAFLWTGDLIRLRDGRKILADVTKVMFGAMVSDGGQKIYAGTYPAASVEAKSIKLDQLKIPLPDKNGSLALEFSLTGPDSATVAQIWSSSEGIGSNPILWKDQLYTFTGGILDAKTGRMVSTGKKGNRVGSNGFILAGEHLYGQPEGATSWAKYASVKNFPDTKEVINVKQLTANGPMVPMPLAPMPGKITDPEELRKVVSVTGFAYYISDYGWHSPYASPFASGNRLFVRTFDTLFCFGDKNQAFTPSKAFEERKP